MSCLFYACDNSTTAKRRSKERYIGEFSKRYRQIPIWAKIGQEWAQHANQLVSFYVSLGRDLVNRPTHQA